MMMEESQKRKERLKAMREEAAASQSMEASASILTPPPHAPSLLDRSPPSLANPLDRSSAKGQTPSRFEFYTDPLAAYTGSRKKNFPRPPAGSSSPSHGSSTSRSVFPPSYQGSPPAYFTPPGMVQPSYWHPQNPSPIWQPNFPTLSSPVTYSTPSSGYPPGSGFGSPQASPAPGFQNTGSSYSPVVPVSLPSSSPSQRHVGNHSQNRQIKNYASSPPGLGCLWPRANRSPGGRGGSPRGRDGRGSGGSGSKIHHRTQRRDYVSARDNPDLFFKKSMLEDPWKDLTPVLQNQGLDAEASGMASRQSWMPKSISNKKPKVTESRVNFTSGPSLAESLAASLADAVSDF